MGWLQDYSVIVTGAGSGLGRATSSSGMSRRALASSPSTAPR